VLFYYYLGFTVDFIQEDYLNLIIWTVKASVTFFFYDNYYQICKNYRNTMMLEAIFKWSNKLLIIFITLFEYNVISCFVSFLWLSFLLYKKINTSAAQKSLHQGVNQVCDQDDEMTATGLPIRLTAPCQSITKQELQKLHKLYSEVSYQARFNSATKRGILRMKS